MTKASILLRVSTVGESQDESLQEPECLEFLKEHKLDLFRVYYEQGSAFKKSFEEREVLQQLISDAKKFDVEYIVVWNMDRYSRLPPEVVLDYTNILAAMYNIKVKAVHGDAWSEVVEAVSKIKDMGFIGKAMAEFLGTLLRGLEHQRAHQESKVKSERVKLAVRKREGKKTLSYKGNKWGRKGLPKQTIDKIKRLRSEGLSIRKIQAQVWVYDKHGNKKKNVSVGKISEVCNCSENPTPKNP